MIWQNAEHQQTREERRWFERDKNTMERNNREANISATARTITSGGGQDKKQDLLSFIFPILFLKPFSSIPLRDCHFDLCMRLSMARHTASSHGDTSILIQTWFSHLKAYASTYAQYSNGYPNLVLPSSLAELQGPVQTEEGRIRNKKTAPQRVTSSGNSKLLSNGNASTAT